MPSSPISAICLTYWRSGWPTRPNRESHENIVICSPAASRAAPAWPKAIPINGRTSSLEPPLFSNDTHYTAESLNRLGIPVTASEGSSFTIDGQGGRIPVKEAELYIGNSGTSARFLTALVALADGGEYHLDGNERM